MEDNSDYLKDDPPVYGQDWSVVSFVNPEDMVLKKFLYYVNHFMVADINKTLTASAMQMAKLLKVTMRNRIEEQLDKLKDSRDPEDRHIGQLLEKRFREMDLDEDEFVDECRRRYELDDKEIDDRYKMYITENRQRLDNDFDQAHDHATSVRGFKIRGNFQRLSDAKSRAQYLRDEVEKAHHTFVVPVGKWFPVDMEADEVQDQEYMLEDLSKMMRKYHEGVHARNRHYLDRKDEMVKEAETHTRQNVKERLQAKLRSNRQAKMKQELEEHQQLVQAKTEGRKKKKGKEQEPEQADT